MGDLGGPGGIQSGHGDSGRAHRFGGPGRTTPSPRDQRDPAVAPDEVRRAELRLDVAATLRGQVQRLETRLDQLSRSLRGYPRIVPPATVVLAESSCRCPDAPGVASAERSPDRPLYAPAALGRIEPEPEVVPPPPLVPRVAGYFDVTNLGTLLDVWA